MTDKDESNNEKKDAMEDIYRRWKKKLGMPEDSKEKPDIFNNSEWLLQWFAHRIKKNRNVIALFIGDTGSGKSYGAIRLAERIDPDFVADRIVFTVKDFLTLVNADLPKGSVVIFDDAGLGINARLWQEESARIFGMLTQGFRYKQILTFITVPDESFIERQSRKLVHIRFEATDTQGIMKPKLMSRNSFDPDRPLTKYPVIRRGGVPITLKTVKLQLPTQPLAEEYERKKNAYMEKRFKEFEEELETLENGGTIRNGKPTVHLTCDDCGYQWDYSGGKTVPRCPNCSARVYTVDRKEEKALSIMLRCMHCGYRWEYSGKQRRTVCPDCEGYVSTTRDRVEQTESLDPFDPMNTPVKPGMTKEEIFDIIAEALIRKGTKIDSSMKGVVEMLAEKAEKELRKNDTEEGEDTYEKRRR